MKKIILLCGFIISVRAIQAQTNTFPSTGDAGIGTTSPTTLLEVKRGIDMGTTGTQYVAPYYIGTCNDFGAGGADQYLLLTPYISGSNSNPSGGLSGKLTFYRGGTTSSNIADEYNVQIQAAYNTTIEDIVPLTSFSNVMNVYKVTYSGIDYVALYMRDVIAPSSSSVSINFQGYYWNNINTQKPQLVLATAVTNPTIIKSYQSAFGDMMFGTASGNIGIGTSSPSAPLHVTNPTALGTSTGNIAEIARFSGLTSNVSQLRIQLNRITAGTDWHTASTRLQCVTDVTNQGYFEFNPSGAIFGIAIGSGTTEAARFLSNGNMLIGKSSQSNSSYKLDVAGTARIDKVVVNTSGADFVFDSSYDLLSLTEVENFIQQNHHLPQIASATEMQANGVDLGENQTKLLQKTEELTLYLINQNNTIKKQDSKIETLEVEIENLKNEVKRSMSDKIHKN